MIRVLTHVQIIRGSLHFVSKCETMRFVRITSRYFALITSGKDAFAPYYASYIVIIAKERHINVNAHMPESSACHYRLRLRMTPITFPLISLSLISPMIRLSLAFSRLSPNTNTVPSSTFRGNVGPPLNCVVSV